jgi:hypothetical protein
MKKSLFVSAFLLIVCNAIAQDIITTTDAQLIKAKIVEVSKDTVKYYEFDNQDGPIFVLGTEDIATIQYQNGKKVEYEVVNEYQDSEDWEETDFIGVIREGNTYYYNGMCLEKDVYESFLQERCLSAYNQYRSGRGLAAGGWTMMGCAAGVGVFVGVCHGIFADETWFKPAIFWAIPGVMTVTSVPLLIAGYNRMHRSADTFNSMCADKQPQVYWSINASQNGIGLAFNF